MQLGQPFSLVDTYSVRITTFWFLLIFYFWHNFLVEIPTLNCWTVLIFIQLDSITVDANKFAQSRDLVRFTRSFFRKMYLFEVTKRTNPLIQYECVAKQIGKITFLPLSISLICSMLNQFYLICHSRCMRHWWRMLSCYICWIASLNIYKTILWLYFVLDIKRLEWKVHSCDPRSMELLTINYNY